MKTSYVAVIAIIASFIISVPVLADDANAYNSKTPGVIMKFCQNPAMTLQDCDEQYDGYTWTDRVNVLIYAPAWNYDLRTGLSISDPPQPHGTAPMSYMAHSLRIDFQIYLLH